MSDPSVTTCNTFTDLKYVGHAESRWTKTLAQRLKWINKSTSAMHAQTDVRHWTASVTTKSFRRHCRALGAQTNEPGASGTRNDLTGDANLLADKLRNQVCAIAEVAKAVTMGDLT